MRLALALLTLASVSACAPPVPPPYTYQQLVGNEPLAQQERGKCRAAEYSARPWQQDYCQMVEHAAGDAFLRRPNRL